MGYITGLQNKREFVRIKEATLLNIIKMLSKYYRNYKFSDLKGIMDTKEE